MQLRTEWKTIDMMARTATASVIDIKNMRTSFEHEFAYELRLRKKKQSVIMAR